MKIDEIVTKLAAGSGTKPGELMKTVNAVFNAIKEAVDKGEKVAVPGIGTFIQKSREGGEKTNAKTGQKRVIEAGTFMSFRAAADRKDRVKKDRVEKGVGAGPRS